ncbi:MAG: ATP-binding protein [Bacteroidales bacterium]|nr:ATP-binding protein [Bacteroidales bacterium]
MEIQRYLKEPIESRLNGDKNKIVILYGARQTGKTTLATHILDASGKKVMAVNADQQKYIDVLSSKDARKLKGLIGKNEILFIDEAQRIPDIGINLKIIHEELPELRVFITGSSSIHIATQVAEALTGRKFVFSLYPLSLKELNYHYSSFEIDDMLEELLIYGSYPEVFTEQGYHEKKLILEELGNSYLYKDIFELTGIRNKKKLSDLLRLLAFQIGSEVSIHELSQQLNLSRDAVNHYLYLLEQSFVIFRLSGFSRNLRKEISKMDKFYFYDNGIRNMIINNYNPKPYRNDLGELWENFVLAERQKYLSYLQIPVNNYFWRIYTGGEIDYIEEHSGNLWGYEIKLNKSAKTKPPKTWTKSYPESSFEVISRENYQQFLI